MTVGVLLLTHPGVGTALLHTVTRILGTCPLHTKCLEIPAGAQTAPLLVKAAELLATLNTGTGVIVCTDLYGATPSNIAYHLAESGHVAIVTGLNLPMLLRVYNYPDNDLDALRRKAADGGARGIVTYTSPNTMGDRARPT